MCRLSSPHFVPMFFILSFMSLVLADNSTSSTDDDSLQTDLLQGNTSMSSFGKLVDKNPELQSLIMRVFIRYKTGANASQEDLDEFRGVLEDAQQKVYDFVTGPQYKNYTNSFIDQAVQLMEPLIAIAPPKDIRKFFEIITKDPELSQAFYGDLAQGQKSWQAIMNDKPVQNEMFHEFVDGFVEGVQEGLQELSMNSTDTEGSNSTLANNSNSTESDVSSSTEASGSSTVGADLSILSDSDVSSTTEANASNSTEVDASNTTESSTTLAPLTTILPDA